MLTVVTHTRNSRPELLKRTIASVEAALVPGVSHQIILCLDNYAKARWEASQLDQYVTFVDDDDTIPPDILAICLEVLRSKAYADVGLLVTEEQRVDLEGRVLAETRGVKTYDALTAHPCIAHSLCVFNRDAVDPRSVDLHNKYTVGVDWAIKTSAGLRGGAVHVPKVGYYWTQHPDSLNSKEHQTFASCMFAIGQDMRSMWSGRHGRIPIWMPESNEHNSVANPKSTSAVGPS